MTLYAYAPGTAVERTGARPKWFGDNGQPLTDAELETHGWFKIAPADDPLPGTVPNGDSHLIKDGNTVRWVQPVKNAPQPTLAERRPGIRAAIEAKGHEIRRGGFEWNFGTDEAPDIQVLELRAPGTPTPENDDEKNWSASLGAYTAAVISGQGDVQGAVFRVESNATYVRSYAEALVILTSMFGWIASILHVVWQKKDEVDGANTNAALDAIEAGIDQGWPGQE